jgi:hypothetical protein
VIVRGVCWGYWKSNQEIFSGGSMSTIAGIVYFVIGVAVAASRHYLGDIGSIGDIVNLLLAILLWPLVLLGVDFNLHFGGGKASNRNGALLPLWLMLDRLPPKH